MIFKLLVNTTYTLFCVHAFLRFQVIFGIYGREIMFWGLSGFSHDKLSLILRECLFSLWLILLLINKRRYPFLRNISLIKSSSAVM